MKEQMLLRVHKEVKDNLKTVAEYEGMTLNGFLNSEFRKLIIKKNKEYGNVLEGVSK